MIDMAERDSNMSQTSLIQKLLNESRVTEEVREDPEALKKQQEAQERERKQKIEEEKRKWKVTISRYDVVLKDHAYYENLPLKPGFEFWSCLIKNNINLDKLKLHIPDTLIVDENVSLITCSKLGALSVVNNPKPSDFLNEVEEKYPQNIHTTFYQPATVRKKPTNH